MTQTLHTFLTEFNWAGWFRAGILLILGLVLSSLLSRGLVRLLVARLSAHQQVMLRRLVFYLVLTLFLVMALREAGFDLSVLLGAAGVFTVAIGFASQTSASNMISGFFLLAEKPFQIGDFIEVENTQGSVIGIDMLSVKLRTTDNRYVRIPNETIIKSRVVNLTRFPVRRVDQVVGVAYKEDLAKVKQLLLDIAEADPLCLEEPKPFVWVMDFGASSVDLQFSFWVRRTDILEVRSRMAETIKASFDREGIEIPFPHTSLYAGSASEPFRIQLVNPEQAPSHVRQEGPDESTT